MTSWFPQVKSESLGISTKMFLKVDIESGKVYFKKSKDGPEDKFFVHNKSECCWLIPRRVWLCGVCKCVQCVIVG